MEQQWGTDSESPLVRGAILFIVGLLVAFTIFVIVADIQKEREEPSNEPTHSVQRLQDSSSSSELTSSSSEFYSR
jgi:hypothetical protein